jgi:hypothetical protein
MDTELQKKSCFVIAPIGMAGSDVRQRSDLIFEHVITPGVSRFGYVPVRADMIAEPGLITNQVIQRVVQDQLVVADISGANPNANVFYELALRHALRKPVVLIADATQTIPFDVAGARAVLVHGLATAELQAAAAELERSVQILERGYRVMDSPVSVALGLMSATDYAALGIQSGDERVSILRKIDRCVICYANEDTWSNFAPRLSTAFRGLSAETVVAD